MLQYGLTSKALCWENEARQRRPHIVWCHLQEMFRTDRPGETENRWGGQVGKNNNNFIMKGLEAWELGDSYSNSISVTKLVRYTTFSKSFPFT